MHELELEVALADSELLIAYISHPHSSLETPKPSSSTPEATPGSANTLPTTLGSQPDLSKFSQSVPDAPTLPPGNADSVINQQLTQHTNSDSPPDSTSTLPPLRNVALQCNDDTCMQLGASAEPSGPFQTFPPLARIPTPPNSEHAYGAHARAQMNVSTGGVAENTSIALPAAFMHVTCAARPGGVAKEAIKEPADLISHQTACISVMQEFLKSLKAKDVNMVRHKTHRCTAL